MVMYIYILIRKLQFNFNFPLQREQIIAEMGAIYSKAKVCRRNNPINKPCDLNLEPGKIMFNAG